MAKIASAFCDPPGMDAFREFQQRMAKIYNSSWVKQLEKTESAFRQFSASIGAFQSIQTATFKQVSAAAQTFAVEMEQFPSWINTIKTSLDLSPVMKLALEEQTTLSLATPISELQSALAAYVSEYAASSEAMQGSSLALQKEHTVKHAFALAGSISGLVDEEEETPDNLPNELSDEDKQVIAKEMSSILASEKNWEQRIMESVTRLKTTHPLLAAILDKIILVILLGIITNFISSAIGQVRTSTKVYDKPQTTSQVVFHLEPLQEVKIIGEQPYYFQIELTDNDTGDTLIGFVSKRSLKVADTEDETSAQN